MTCREFTRNIEGLSLSELSSFKDTEMLAHKGDCAACGGLLQERRTLAGAMQVLRSSTAGVQAPVVVEQNVLRAFRQSAGRPAVAESGSLANLFAFRVSRWFEWGTYAAVGAALAVSLGLGGWYWQHQRKAGNETAQPITAAQSSVAQQEDRTQVQPASVMPTPTAQRGTITAAVSKSEPVASVPVLAQAQQAQGYTPMMLCDPLSCSGDEQVVRMELPAADGSTETQMADVIIGDDGLVRAIRIVQQ